MEDFRLTVSLTRFLNKLLPHFNIILNWLHIGAGEEWVLTLTDLRRICLIHFRNSKNCNEEYGHWNKCHNRQTPHKHSQAAFHSLLLTPGHDSFDTHAINLLINYDSWSFLKFSLRQNWTLMIDEHHPQLGNWLLVMSPTNSASPSLLIWELRLSLPCLLILAIKKQIYQIPSLLYFQTCWRLYAAIHIFVSRG